MSESRCTYGSLLYDFDRWFRLAVLRSEGIALRRSSLRLMREIHRVNRDRRNLCDECGRRIEAEKVH